MAKAMADTTAVPWLALRCRLGGFGLFFFFVFSSLFVFLFVFLGYIMLDFLILVRFGGLFLFFCTS